MEGTNGRRVPEIGKKGGVAAFSEHVRKYLILYTMLSVAVAVSIGYSSGFTARPAEPKRRSR